MPVTLEADPDPSHWAAPTRVDPVTLEADSEPTPGAGGGGANAMDG